MERSENQSIDNVDNENITKELTWRDRYFKGKKEPSSALGVVIIIFIIASLVVWAIIVLISPEWCSGPTGCIDNGKTFSAALILAFVIVIVLIVFWLVLSNYYK